MTLVSVLGAGLMGTAVVKRLLASGFDVQVWNRTAEKARSLIQTGATVMTTPAAAIENCDAVILLLLNHEVARQVLGPDAQLLRGKDVLDLMTGGPKAALELSADVHSLGGSYLKGAVQSFPSAIGSRDALIYISGDMLAWNRQRAAVQAIAPGSRYLGSRVDASSLVDAAVSGAFATVAIGAWLEAIAFMADSGLSLESSDVDWWVRQLGADMRRVLEEARSGDFSTDDASLAIHAAALSKWRQVLIDGGHRAGITTAALHNMELALAAGLGAASWASQLQILRNPATCDS